MWHWFNLSTFYENNNKTALAKNVKDVILKHPAQNLYMDMWRQSLVTGKIPHFSCLALRNFLVIRCNGDVVPCLTKWNEPVGNIKRESISSIWQSKQMMIERNKIAKCSGCLNSWGVSWSINEPYFSVLKDVVQRKVKRIAHKL